MGRARIILSPTSTIHKQIGQFRKLFGLWKNSNRKDPVESTRNPAPIAEEGRPEFLNRYSGIHTKHITRRQIVLNRHFTEIVSDILANNLDKEFQECGVTITSIETKAWNKGVKVFYFNNKPFDRELHMRLNSLVPKIRLGITERRIIGRTPEIVFLYDQSKYLGLKLNESLKDIRIHEEQEEKRITITSQNQVYVTKNLGSPEPSLVSKRFSAPSDMKNTMLGLDYPTLYDRVALTLERGRGESSRMIPSFGLTQSARPMFKAPTQDQDIEDPAKRIIRMKKFLVSQRMKSEHIVRYRRKMELLSRDTYKWTIPREEEESNLGEKDNPYDE